jgi:eukaryotic-like serine/threonine-protein kinase
VGAYPTRRARRAVAEEDAHQRMGYLPARAMTTTRSIGRYLIAEEIAAGGMATVHFGRVTGAAGFARLVAIKRLLPNFAKDPDFVTMFVDEARLASRIRHPNVVPTLDVVSDDGELLVVMEYVPGETLARILRAANASGQGPIPPGVASAILAGMLLGLHAAHEARDERGRPLEIVHRDVSPQNVMLGEDGAVHVLDFGIARAIGRLQTTQDGQLKGKVAYMAPEQLLGEASDRRLDVYAAAVVLWETLTCRPLFRANSEGETMYRVLHEVVLPPSELAPGISPALDEVVLRGLARDPAARFSTAAEMAHALEAACPPASMLQLSTWIRALVGPVLAARAERADSVEQTARNLPAPAFVSTSGVVLTPSQPMSGRLPADSAERISVPSTSAVPTAVLAAGGLEAAPVPPPRSSPGLLLAAGAALLAIVLGLSVLVLVLRDRGAAEGGPLAADDDGRSTPSASAAASAASAGPDEHAVEPVASVSAAPAASSAPPVQSVTPPRSPPPVPKHPPSCASPFYVDAKGIQRVRRECL